MESAGENRKIVTAQIPSRTNAVERIRFPTEAMIRNENEESRVAARVISWAV